MASGAGERGGHRTGGLAGNGAPHLPQGQCLPGNHQRRQPDRRRHPRHRLGTPLQRGQCQPIIANNCLTGQPLQISGTLGSSTYAITPGGSTSFKFTPRGTVNAAAADTQLASPDVIEISLTGTSGPLRCVRISEGLGLISVGASNSSGGTCPDNSYGGTL
jgi:hypothetical protein